MAGGIGSRFWPMSTTNHPKQFIDVLGVGQTLLQQTYKRKRIGGRKYSKKSRKHRKSHRRT